MHFEIWKSLTDNEKLVLYILRRDLHDKSIERNMSYEYSVEVVSRLRLTVTLGNRDLLLQFLNYPKIPRHISESEMAAREPVIKRKISYRTRSELGKCAREKRSID